MIEAKVEGADKQGSAFDKNRFIGIIGRHAFHVFDLEAMDFLYADPERGYMVNIDEFKDKDKDKTN